jgi:hypothetical protein
MKSFAGPGPLAAGASATFTSPFTKTSDCYLYIEYKSANFQLSFDRTLKDLIIPASSGISVQLTGAKDYAGKNFVFALASVDPDTAMTGSSSSSSPGPSGMIGWGMGKIGADGSATVLAMNETLTAPVDPAKAAGPAYLIAFIDTDGSITDLATADFDTNDLYYFSDAPFTLSGSPQIIPVDRGAFLAYPGDSSGSADLKVSFAGSPTFAGHNFFFGIQTSPTSGPTSTIGLIAAGSFLLDAAGSGIGVPVDLATNKPIVLSPGVTYYLTAFIDMNDNYKNVTALSSADISGIMPHTGDYATDVPIAFIAAPSSVISVAASILSLTTSNSIFVAQTAVGTGTGGTPANACTIATAFTMANAAPATTETSIYLVGTVTPTVTLKATSKIMIAGKDASSVLKLAGAGLLASAGSELAIMGIQIDASTYSGTVSPLQVDTGGKFVLFQSYFTGNSTTSAVVNGGVASIAEGSFTLYGSTINSASATGNGGAIYLVNPAGASPYSAIFAMMDGSKILNCHTGGNGGAVYVAAYSAVSLSGTETFTGNTKGAAVAHDIYTAEVTSMIFDPGLLIPGGKVIHSGVGTIMTTAPTP